MVSMMPLPFTISDLRQRPEFFDTVAERIWQAWWKPDNYPLGHITGRLRENMTETSIPLALVAHDGEAFLGTASVIASDLAERPQLTPWVAAVWVEPQARRRGVGGALVNRAATLSTGRLREHSWCRFTRVSAKVAFGDRLLRLPKCLQIHLAAARRIERDRPKPDA